MTSLMSRSKLLLKSLAIIALLLMSTPSFAELALVGTGQGVPLANNELRIVFPINKKVSVNSFRLENPARLVIDIPQAKLRNQVRSLPISNAFVTGVRLGTQQGYDLRIVVDLKQSIPASTALVKGPQGYELVILLGRDQSSEITAKDETLITPQKEIKVAKTVPKKEVLIIIDPGHGGKDPGALGPGGSREKDIVLQIAKKLAAKINAQPGMKAVMTRNNDTFIPLRQRVLIARRHKADMFVSIHADAATRRVDGASVYMLSTSGASSELARLLAESANQSDLIGGADLSDRDKELASMLLDISQDATSEASHALGRHVLAALGKNVRLFKRNVERAGFAVLKAPDIPSILVETGFITTPNEEKQLKSGAYQDRLAGYILNGIKSYYQERPATEIVYTTVTQDVPQTAVTSTQMPDSTFTTPEQSGPQLPPIRFSAESKQAPPPALPPIRFSSSSQQGGGAIDEHLHSQVAVKVYRVKEGDTIREVAKRFGILEGQLKRANSLPNNQLRVPIGTELIIP